MTNADHITDYPLSPDVARLNADKLTPAGREAAASVALDTDDRGGTYVVEQAEVTEADVQRACLEYLRYHPRVGFVRRFNAGLIITKDDNAVQLGKKNDPDIIAILRGPARLIAVECKRPGGRPRLGQIERLNELAEDGAITIVVDDVAQLEALIDDVTAGPPPISAGTRVTVADHGTGTVTEALPQARDWRGDVRTPYRVALDSGGEFLAHPESLEVIG